MKNIFFGLISILIVLGCNSKTSVEGSLSKSDSLNTILTKEIEELNLRLSEKSDSIFELHLVHQRLKELKGLIDPTDISANIRSWESFIKVHSGIVNDSIKILGAESWDGMHTFTFIDYNKHSKYHEMILNNYSCDCVHETVYKSTYYKGLELWKDSISNKLNDFDHIKGHWLPIQRMSSKSFAFYFTMCEMPDMGLTISDSTISQYYGHDGAYPSILRSIDTTSNQIIINKGEQEIVLERYRDSDIYVWNDDGRNYFLINESYRNNYPIIVVECHELGAGDNHPIQFKELK